MWRKVGLAVLVVAVLALIAGVIYQQVKGGAAFSFHIGAPKGKSSKKSEKKEPEPNFEEARRGDLKLVVEATGATEPISSIEVKAEATGRITEFVVKEGDKVKAGDVLCKLDQSTQQLLVQADELNVKKAYLAYQEAKAGQSSSSRSSLESAVANAKSSLASAKTTYENAQAALARVEELHKKGYATDQELDNAKSAVGTAQAGVESAQAALKNAEQLRSFEESSNQSSIDQARLNYESAKVGLAEAKKQLGKGVVVSPIDGIILEKPLDVGDSVISINSAFGGGTTIVKVADLRRVKVRTNVDEVDIGKIKIGQRATVKVDAYPDKEFQGAVTNIFPQGVTSGTGLISFIAMVEVENPGGLLYGNMTSSVSIEAQVLRNVLLVPLAATRAGKEPDTTIVLVLKDGEKEDNPKAKTDEREVKLGDTDFKDVVVLDGLKEGEKVKVRGFQTSFTFE
jgi:macrolide-specific efflux system membrane fusion protein